MKAIVPIALFVYNRPIHTRRTVEALAKNNIAKDSVLNIFSDAPKSDSDIETVKEVRSYIKSITGFMQVNIIERVENYGLAKSIICGVSDLCDKYGKVIVLEDDLETSPYFLNYMNESLSYYETNAEVMHISGCRYPVEPFGNSDTFFLHVPLCWGWATWQSAWVHFKKDISVMDSFNRSMIKKFDFDDSYNYWEQLILNKSGKINTWFIFWYATLFLRGGLALFPARSLVQNIGLDDSGSNCAETTDYDVILSSTPVELNDIPCTESNIGFEMHREYFRKLRVSLLRRVIRKLRRIFCI